MSTASSYQAERRELLMLVGDNIRELRAPLTQEGLADRARLDSTGISKYERGVSEPGVLYLVVLADALGVSLDRLVRGVPPPEERKPPPKRARKKPTRKTAAKGAKAKARTT